MDGGVTISWTYAKKEISNISEVVRNSIDVYKQLKKTVPKITCAYIEEMYIHLLSLVSCYDHFDPPESVALHLFKCVLRTTYKFFSEYMGVSKAYLNEFQLKDLASLGFSVYTKELDWEEE